jgi:hypothetical protein
MPADEPFEKLLPQLRKAFPDQARLLSAPPVSSMHG